jgi:putative membrane protein insertion efficiency factor
MLSKIVIGILYLYRWMVSPLLPPSCRYVPTCSRYAIQAIQIHGLAKGLWLTTKRLSTCHPFTSFKIAFFHDPVPAKTATPANMPLNKKITHQ